MSCAMLKLTLALSIGWATGDARLCANAITGDVRLRADTVPRINMSAPEDEIVASLVAASSGPGIFYLVGHGIAQTVLDDALKASDSFYQQPHGVKQELSALGYGGPVGGRRVPSKGYVAPGFEGSYAKDAATDVRPEAEQASLLKNMREAMVFRYPEEGSVREDAYYKDYRAFSGEMTEGARAYLGPERVDDTAQAARSFFLPNQWPSADLLPDFRPRAERLFHDFERVASRMFRLWELAANTSSASVLRQHDRGMWTINLAHYPPTPSAAAGEEFGIADHTDWEAFTLLYPRYRDTENNPNVDPASGVAYTGLEAYLEGSWVRVPHIPGALIVNQGEMLSRLSGGRFKAPVHRVQAASDFRRYSIVSFWAPNYDTLLPDPEHGHILTGEYYLKRNGFL